MVWYLSPYVGGHLLQAGETVPKVLQPHLTWFPPKTVLSPPSKAHLKGS